MKNLSVKYFTISNVYVITFLIFTSFNQFGHGFNLIATAFTKYLNYVINWMKWHSV